MADRRRRAAALTVVGVLAMLALVVWVPHLTRTRDVLLATPGPPPIKITTPIALPADGRTCVDNVTLDPGLEAVRTQVLQPRGRRGGPVDVVLYDARDREVGRGSFPPGFGIPSLLRASVRHSLKRSIVGTVCLDNHGRALTMQGTDESRARTRSNTKVDGTQVVGDLTLETLARPSSVTSHLGSILDRAASFKPLTPWEVGVLAVLVILAVPAGLTLALWRAFPRDEDEDRRG